MPLPPDTLLALRFGAEPRWPADYLATTLGAFLADNADGLDDGEPELIEAALVERGSYRGGGGASLEWRIELARPLASADTCAPRAWPC